MASVTVNFITLFAAIKKRAVDREFSRETGRPLTDDIFALVKVRLKAEIVTMAEPSAAPWRWSQAEV